MFGFGLECLFRGTIADETCEFPLYTFVVIQLALIALLQFAVPISKYMSQRSTTRSPSVVGTFFLLQLIWIVLGIMWYTSDSDCESSAPYLTYGTKWLVLVYGAVVPLEFFWWTMWICKEKSESERASKMAV